MKPPDMEKQIPIENELIKKIVDLIEQDLEKQWSTQELAKRVLISPSHLHRKLTSITGMHTTELIRFIRLTNAQHLLKANPDWTISQTAYKVGFNSLPEFSRRFKSVFGSSPKKWREKQ